MNSTSNIRLVFYLNSFIGTISIKHFTNSSNRCLFYKVAMSIVLPNRIELAHACIAVQDGGLCNVDHPRTAPYAQYVICINNEFGITRRASNQAVHHSSLDAH